MDTASIALLSAAGFSSGWPEGAAAPEPTACCCLLVSVVLEMHTDGDVDSVLDDVDVVTLCCSVGWPTVPSEAESFPGHEGVRPETETSGREAKFCWEVSVAGDRWGFSGSLVSTVADWLGLGRESGMTAGT